MSTQDVNREDLVRCSAWLGHVQWIQIRRGQKAHAVTMPRLHGIHWHALCGIGGTGGVINGGEEKCKACLREGNKRWPNDPDQRPGEK